MTNGPQGNEPATAHRPPPIKDAAMCVLGVVVVVHGHALRMRTPCGYFYFMRGKLNNFNFYCSAALGSSLLEGHSGGS